MLPRTQSVRCVVILSMVASCFPAVAEGKGQACSADAADTGNAQQRNRTAERYLLQAGVKQQVAANITLKDEDRSSSLLTRSQRKERFNLLIGTVISLTRIAVSCANLAQLNEELDAAEEALQLSMDEKSDLEEEISTLNAELHSLEGTCTFATTWTTPTPPAGSGPCLSEPELQLIADPAEDAAYDYNPSNHFCLVDGQSFQDTTTVIIIGSNPGSGSQDSLKCVPDPGVFCAPNAGDLGFRVNKDQAEFTFHIYHSEGQVCAQRTDFAKGWAMNLEIQCVQPVAHAFFEVTGCEDSSWNGHYVWDGQDKLSMDSTHQIYQYNGVWRIGNYGVEVYALKVEGNGDETATFQHGCLVNQSTVEACCPGLEWVAENNASRVCQTPGQKCGNDSFTLPLKMDLESCLQTMETESCASGQISWEADADNVGYCTCCADSSVKSAREFRDAHSRSSVYELRAVATTETGRAACKNKCKDDPQCGSWSWNPTLLQCRLNKGPCHHRQLSTEDDGQWDRFRDANKDVEDRILGPGKCHESYLNTHWPAPDCKALCVADPDCMYYSFKLVDGHYRCQTFSKHSTCTLPCDCKVKLHDNSDGSGASFTVVEQDVWVNLPNNRKNEASSIEISGYGCQVRPALGEDGASPWFLIKAPDSAPFNKTSSADSYSWWPDDDIESVKLTCSANAEEAWQTRIVTEPCASDQESRIRAKREEIKAKTGELVELEKDLEALEAAMQLQQAHVDANACMIIVEGLKKVLDFLKDFLCEITTVTLWALAKALDAALLANPATGAIIGPMQAKPMCLPSSLYGKWGSKGAKLVKGGLMQGYVKLMCMIKEIGGGAQTFFENTDIISETVDFTGVGCMVGVATGAIIEFVTNMACGNIAAAIQTLATPAIMCRLPWKPDGSMCQKDGCIFGPYSSSLVQSKARIRNLITSGSLLSTRAQ